MTALGLGVAATLDIVRAYLPRGSDAYRRTEDLQDDDGTVYRADGNHVLVEVMWPHPRCALIVVVPCTPEGFDSPPQAADEIQRRATEAAQLSAARARADWPAHWPSVGVVLACPHCETARIWLTAEFGARWLGLHVHAKHPETEAALSACMSANEIQVLTDDAIHEAIATDLEVILDRLETGQADNEIRVTPELLAAILEQGNEMHIGVLDGVPKGARITGARFDDSPWPMVVLEFDQIVPTAVTFKRLPCADDRRRKA